MQNEELEKTKCLDNDLSELKEEKEDIYEEYKKILREEKYSNVGQVVDNTKEYETLDLEPVNEDEKKDEKETELKKEKLFTKIKNKWHNLPKKKKIIFVIIVILVLILIISLVVLFVTKGKKEEPKIDVKEDVIIIKDNYIYRNGSLFFLDDDDKELGEYECNNKDENKCYVAYNGVTEDTLNGVINVYEDGSVIEKRLDIYNERYAFIFDSDKEKDVIILYDFKEKKKIDEYNLVKTYKVNDTNYIVVQDKKDNYALYEVGSDGLVKKIEGEYSYLGIIESKENNHVIASTTTANYLLDYEGKELTKLIPEKIVDYSDDYVVTLNKGVYSLYTYDTKQKLTGYKFMVLEKDYIYSVDSSNALFVKDKELNKLNEEGINLSTEEFRVKNQYTKDGVKVKSLFAFMTNYGEDKLTLTLSTNENKSFSYVYLNLEEAKFNKKLKYYSYLDGKLYFYEDEAKDKLIGSYKCTNKNEKFDGDELTNCRPAFDTVFEDNDITNDKGRVSMAPLYNKRYIFIEDRTNNTKTINLYDLKDNNTLSSYEDINTYTMANKGELTLVSVSSTNVIVKNKNGKYGMVSIGNDKPSPVYPLDYNYMEMMGDKVLAKNKDNKWLIIYGKDNTSALYGDKIRGFIGTSYLKTKGDSGYNVHKSNDSNKLNKDSYAYVELYTDFYAGIDSKNNLMLYDYEGNEIITDAVPLESTNYYGNEAKAFIIAVSGTTYNIQVLNNDTYNTVSKTKKVKEEKPQEPQEPQPTEPTEPNEVIENEE